MTRGNMAVVMGTLLCLAALPGTGAEPPQAGGPKKATETHALTGLLASKGEDWVLVKNEQEQQKVRCETTDKALIAAIDKLTVPSRVKVTWTTDGERKVLASVEAVGAAGNATVEGVVTAKGNNWIEIKLPAGNTERYTVYYANAGNAAAMTATIAKTEIGAHVKIEWLYHEHNRVVKLEPIPDASQPPAKN